MKRLILHLGGGLDRADQCIELANQFPDAPIFISSECGGVIQYYVDRNIDVSRITLDMNAWDTVTNFTHTYQTIKKQYNPDVIHVVTHEFHMRRSMLIAQAVYWRRNVSLIASPAPGPDPYGTGTEPNQMTLEDGLRAWIWRLTGILFYTQKVRDERSSMMGTPKKWNEIGL